MNQIDIMGVPIAPVTMEETLQHCKAFIETTHQLNQICTVNPEFVIKAHKNSEFMQMLQTTELNVADGNGILIAGKWFGTPMPERVAGSEMVYHLARRCAENGWRLFLLGAAPGIADIAAEKLQSYYDGLQIAGTYSGSPSLEENDKIVALINESKADVLYVAYGAPKQDLWIARNKETLTTVRVAIGVGGSLDFIAGKIQRAPIWVQNLGLEWFHRLLKEPSRWRRVWMLPLFGLQATKVALQKKFSR